MYSEGCMDVKTAISNSKSEILQKKISECNGDQKKLFKIVDTLLGRNKHTTLPKYDSPLTMASVMNNFFIDKIDNIRAEFPLLEANLPCYSFLSMDSIMPLCTIDHDNLFYILEKYVGIGGSALRLIRSYFSDRTQRVGG